MGFGYPIHEKAICGWQARAIFKPLVKPYRQGDSWTNPTPLDLLPDRQGGQGFEGNTEPSARWDIFKAVLNMVVLPALQKLSQGFGTDSHEVLCKHFQWPHNFNLVLVAQGSPNGSYGYFYVSVSLMWKEDVKKDPTLESRETEAEKSEKRRAELNRQLAQRQLENDARDREDRARQRVARAAERQAQSARQQEIDAAPFKRPGLPLNVGDRVRINANQADRDALVRAVSGDEALIEYWMPRGKSFLWIINANTQNRVRVVSKNKLPKKWQVAG